MTMAFTKKMVLVAIACQMLSTAFAAETDDNPGFLSDYSNLQPAPDNALTQYYISPGARENLALYKSIMVDQPQVFIAKDSPYHGIKPARINIIAEALRQHVITALSEDYQVVETTGPGVLYLRLALVDLSIKKDRFHILGYTPIGLVYRAGQDVVQSDYANAVKHISLVGLNVEGELRDSQSSEVLGKFVDTFASTTTPKTWKDLATEMENFGAAINCQIKNGRSRADDQVNCHPSGTTNSSGS
jgi:hypothetical protein